MDSCSEKSNKNETELQQLRSVSTNSTVDWVICAIASIKSNNVAIDDKNGTLTYAKLLANAMVVSEYLLQANVKTGDRVIILCPRNGCSLSAVLGVLMIGGVYVPISPNYPTARIDYIAKDSASHLAIVDQSYLDKCPKRVNALIIQDILKCENKLLDYQTRKSALSDGNTSRAAYILYTSGSTGRPKGVVVPHSALMNTLIWMIGAFDVRAGESIPQKTPWGFTDSLWEMFLPLLVGGRVVFIDDETVINPIALYHELNENKAVVTQFVPSALSTFLDGVCREIPSPALPSLRWILNGGEELPRSLVDRWFNVFPNIGYANSYGMTESAIYATCYFMKTAPVWGMRRIPIGKPITNAEVVIMGENNETLEPDQVGEICIGGRSLMNSYWEKPELTSQALISHSQTGRTFYRTGDYGSVRYDGQIAYLGRKDHQVKIRGMRIELGEVERALLDHPCVKQVAVVIHGEGENRTLIAFYTVYEDDPDEKAVLDHLEGALPSYMIPTRCVRLDSFPVTAHNKTDRAKLLRMSLPVRSTKCVEKPLLGSVAHDIYQVWAEVLGHEGFGIDEGFFAAGGNSLLLVRLYARFPSVYQRVVSIPDLLHYPTIRSLSQKIQEELAERSISIPSGPMGTMRNPAVLKSLRDPLNHEA